MTDIGSQAYRMVDRTVALLLMLSFAAVFAGQVRAQSSALESLLRTVDLDVGETQSVVLYDGSKAEVRVAGVNVERGELMGAIRDVAISVTVNGNQGEIHCGNYHLPQTIGGVQVDCPVTHDYYQHANQDAWGLNKEVRLRLWPGESPWIRPGSFVYPVTQRWFAARTSYSNEPVARDNEGNIYYHSGLDLSGAEGRVWVLAATDGRVVEAAGKQLDDMPEPHPPIELHKANIWIQGPRGWFHYYTHLKRVDVDPGDVVSAGDTLGLLGKEVGSGGWSHLHYEIKARQPSGEWGTMEGYAFLWEAYQRQYDPRVIAVARPHRLARVGENVTFDARKSWAECGMKRVVWTFSDGTRKMGSVVEKSYSTPGVYREIVRVTDCQGNVDYDIADVRISDKDEVDFSPPRIHATYYPTFNIQSGDLVTFQVRARDRSEGVDIWNFGDGSAPVRVKSNLDDNPYAPNGYATTTHRYSAPGHYIVTVHRTGGPPTTSRLHVVVQDTTD